MTVRSFKFESAAAEKDRDKVEIDVNGEKFELVNDLLGIELLEHIAMCSGGAGSTRGVATFLRRVVRADDWDRFTKAMTPAKPDDIGLMVGELIDAYSSFPTTPAESSSTGS